MLTIVGTTTADVIAQSIAADALRLPAKFRMAFLESSLSRESRVARSVLQRAVELEHVALDNMEGFLESLGVLETVRAVSIIDRQPSKRSSVVDCEGLLEQLDFSTSHERLAAFARTNDVLALVDRYGVAHRDRLDMLFLCHQLAELRQSLRIYNEGGVTLFRGKYRRFELKGGCDYLVAMLPGLNWQTR